MDNVGKFQFEVITGGNENILELEMWTVFHTSRGGGRRMKSRLR